MSEELESAQKEQRKIGQASSNPKTTPKTFNWPAEMIKDYNEFLSVS